MPNSDAELTDDNYPGPWYVNMYETNKAEGGSEEGGWFYDYGDPYDYDADTPATNGPFATIEEAEEVHTRLQEKAAEINTTERRPPPSSVSCRGYIRAYLETEPAKAFPTSKPRYE